MDRQAILRLNAGRVKSDKVDISRPGEMIESPDGDPLGMSETEYLAANTSMPVRPVLASDLAKAGLTPDDVPNCRIVPDPE